MASHQELSIEWTMLDQNSMNWTLEDLELAAELGRTLLERNAELENDVKAQQAVIDDQAQEIEFLTKQNSTMKEESATRSKFYEQLESTIFELERTNVQLSRKHEVDKKRIQSLCENIDYLERKCEEMTGTLETIRDESKKNYGTTGKMSRSSYLSYTGSDSSEDDSFTFFKRRSQSLHDLRDFTPSPDEFDSNNSHSSHSPELKASETEFIESLETKIEQLLSVKKKEQDKIHQMEAQMRILIQENANLQEQLNLIQTQKEEEITELRKQLLDTSNYAQQTLSMASQLCLPSLSSSSSLSSSQPPNNNNSDNQSGKHSHSSLSSSSQQSQSPHSDSGLENWTHSPLTSSVLLNNSNQEEEKSLQQSLAWTNFHQKFSSPDSIQFQFPPCGTAANVLCKRCSAEINLLNLVNSIEVENDDETENLDIDGGEFNSLEHELARATGHHNSLSSSYNNPSSRRRQNNINNNKNRINSDTSSSSHNGGRDSMWPWGIRRPSLLDLFLSDRAEEEEVGEEACETQVDFPPTIYSKWSKSTTEPDDDEDPCLQKDRGPEKEKLNGLCRRRNGNKRFTKLQLPQKIPHEEDEKEQKEGFHDGENKVSQLSCRSESDYLKMVENEKSDLAVNENEQQKIDDEKAGKEVMTKLSSISETSVTKKKRGVAVHFQLDEEQEEEAEEAENFCDALYCGFNCTTTTTTGGNNNNKIIEESVTQAPPCPPVSVFLTPVPASETIEQIEEEASSLFSALSSLSSTCALMDVHSSSSSSSSSLSSSSSSSLSSQPLRNSIEPEYKQILDKMFNLFQNSRQTYPAAAAVYPFMAHANR